MKKHRSKDVVQAILGYKLLQKSYFSMTKDSCFNAAKNFYLDKTTGEEKDLIEKSSPLGKCPDMFD